MGGIEGYVGLPRFRLLGYRAARRVGTTKMAGSAPCVVGGPLRCRVSGRWNGGKYGGYVCVGKCEGR